MPTEAFILLIMSMHGAAQAAVMGRYEALQQTDTLAVALWSMMHGYVSLRLSGMFQPAEDRLTSEPRCEALMSLLSPPVNPAPSGPRKRSTRKS